MNLQQDSDVSTKDLEAKRKKMKSIYDSYVRQYGNLLKRTTSNGRLKGRPHIETALGYFREVRIKDKLGKITIKRVFTTEPETYILKGIEIEKVITGKDGGQKQSFTPAQVLTERTYTPTKSIDKVSTAFDGLVASINSLGYLDMDYIVKIYGKSEEAIVKEMGDGIFKNPIGGWETDDEYLSGNVKKKLARSQEHCRTGTGIPKEILTPWRRFFLKMYQLLT